jgi:hypothetical protein
MKHDCVLQEDWSKEVSSYFFSANPAALLLPETSVAA